MAELRYHPFKRDWTMVASHRQSRPQMPVGWCPFCPGSGNVPDEYDVYEYDNDFPALSQSPPAPDDVGDDFFQVAPAYGKCEVILYSSNHTATLPDLTLPHVEKLVALWQERYKVIAADPEIAYIYIFENRGKEVGVTMPHPHGQIYGYPFIPPRMKKELDSCRDYKEDTGRNLFSDWIAHERKSGQRIVFENEHFLVVLPYFAETVYGIWIVAKDEKVQRVTDLDQEGQASLAQALRDSVGMLDSLFDQPMPYMMAQHQSPPQAGDLSDQYRYAIEFIPVLRAADKQQFFASSESGAGAFCNPTAPEEKAQELREAWDRFQKTLKARGE